MPEGALEDIRNYQVEPRTPMVGRLIAEMDPHQMRVQGLVCFCARQRKWIDVRAYDELSTSGSGDSGQYSRTGSDVQNGFRLPLPAKEVHYTGAEARGWMGSIPKHRGPCCSLGKLGQREPALLHRRRR